MLFSLEKEAKADSIFNWFAERTPIDNIYDAIQLIICALGIIPNCWLIYAILKDGCVGILHQMNIHLAIVCIITGIFGAYDVFGYTVGSSFCPGFFYLQDMIINLIALSFFCTSAERLRRLNTNCTDGFTISQFVIIIWGTAAVVAIPTLFAVTVVDDVHEDGKVHSTCCRKPMMGYYVVGLLYRVFLFSVEYAALAAWTIYEYCRMRAKIIRMQQTSGSDLLHYNAVRPYIRSQMHIVLGNICIFVLLWVPFGLVYSFSDNVVLSTEKDQHFKTKSSTFMDSMQGNCEEKLLSHTGFYNVVMLVFYLYVQVMPFCVLCIHRALSVCLHGLTVRNNDPNVIVRPNEMEMRPNAIDISDEGPPTVGHSPASTPPTQPRTSRPRRVYNGMGGGLFRENNYAIYGRGSPRRGAGQMGN